MSILICKYLLFIPIYYPLFIRSKLIFSLIWWVIVPLSLFTILGLLHKTVWVWAFVVSPVRTLNDAVFFLLLNSLKFHFFCCFYFCHRFSCSFLCWTRTSTKNSIDFKKWRMQFRLMKLRILHKFLWLLKFPIFKYNLLSVEVNLFGIWIIAFISIFQFNFGFCLLYWILICGIYSGIWNWVDPWDPFARHDKVIVSSCRSSLLLLYELWYDQCEAEEWPKLIKLHYWQIIVNYLCRNWTLSLDSMHRASTRTLPCKLERISYYRQITDGNTNTCMRYC